MPFLDRITIADSLKSPDTCWLIIIVMWCVTIIGYTFIFKLARKMSVFESLPADRIKESYICHHSIIIKGLNQDLGILSANEKVF